MANRLQEALLHTISRVTGRVARSGIFTPLGGGCINSACVVRTDDGRRFFAKSNADAPADMFEREAEGLRALRAARVLRVPEVVATGSAGGEHFIIMEHLASAPPWPRYAEDLGRGLARLHRASTSPRAGFAHDNYCGATPQPNAWCSDWVEFFRERRLGYQLRLVRERGHATQELEDRLGRLMQRLGDIIGEPHEPFALLHGDLWSGNHLPDDRGAPALIDPAAYYGHREAELGMMVLYGSFPPELYAAYVAEWPLAPGWERRVEVYKLYHLLNHLNLFGGGYGAQCVEVLRKLG